MRKPREAKSDYDVGYGKPPVAGQFKPGQSGNPRGRKKGTLDTKTYYEQAVSAKVTVKVDGREVRMTKIEAAIHQTINKAARGDLRALVHTLEELKRLGIGLGVPDAGTAQVPVSSFYASVIERALADRTPDAAEPSADEGAAEDGEDGGD
jgi:hypothetical protein